MRTSRREFVRWMGLGVTGTALAHRRAAQASQIRVLSGGPEEPALDFQRFVASVRVGPGSGHDPLQVFWLSGPSAPPLTVTTLEEARARGDVVIVERDQATVPELIVDNRGKSHVLLLAGEILVGGKQNRVLMEDILLPPQSGPRPLGVYCVEQARWAGRTKEFEARGSFAAPGLRSQVLRKASQQRVWAEVDRYARSAAAPSATRDYQAIYDKPEVRAHLEEIKRRLDGPLAPGALGAAVFAAQTLVGLDLFFDPDLFAREWPKLLHAHALDGYRQLRPADATEGGLRGRVEALLQAAGNAGGATRENVGVGHLLEYRVPGHWGAALVFDGRVVHAAIV
ncbi:MAG: hypothetical protein HY002_07630 [Candidatus Rokubacteria bacterium]|nr:hypothetical protein [Candidatus Rokubacteria bacterium]